MMKLTTLNSKVAENEKITTEPSQADLCLMLSTFPGRRPQGREGGNGSNEWTECTNGEMRTGSPSPKPAADDIENTNNGDNLQPPLHYSRDIGPVLDKLLDMGQVFAGAMAYAFQPWCGYPRSHLCPGGIWHSQWSCPSPEDKTTGCEGWGNNIDLTSVNSMFGLSPQQSPKPHNPKKLALHNLRKNWLHHDDGFLCTPNTRFHYNCLSLHVHPSHCNSTYTSTPSFSLSDLLSSSP